MRAAHRRTRVNLVLNTILFVLIVVEIFSGLEISQVALPSFGFAGIDDRTWRALHNQSLNWIHLTVGLHVAMNWTWILAAIRRFINGERARRVILAPGIGTALFWAVCVFAASALVSAAVYAELGPPTISRLLIKDEVARFRPTIGHGAIQFLGESFLLAVVVLVGRKWLRLRI